MPAENPHPDGRRPDPQRSADRRRYEDAVLAALEFEPELDPDLVAAFGSSRAARPADRARRATRPAIRLAALIAMHVVLAVVFAELLASGGGIAVVVAGAGWLTCTLLIARTIFRAGARLRGLPA